MSCVTSLFLRTQAFSRDWYRGDKGSAKPGAFDLKRATVRVTSIDGPNTNLRRDQLVVLGGDEASNTISYIELIGCGGELNGGSMCADWIDRGHAGQLSRRQIGWVHDRDRRAWVAGLSLRLGARRRDRYG